MSENRPPLNMPTDSKTIFEIFQTKKLPLKIPKPKISLKSQNVRKLTPQICLPKYAHSDYKTFKIFKNQTKK